MRTWTAVNSLQMKRVVRAFRSVGATSRDKAVTLGELGVRPNKVFRYLCEDGVIVAVGDERYYLDEAQARIWIAKFRRRTLIWAAILLVAFILFLIAALSRG